MKQNEAREFVERLLSGLLHAEIIDDYLVENIDADHFQATVIGSKKELIIQLYGHFAIEGDNPKLRSTYNDYKEEQYD